MGPNNLQNVNGQIRPSPNAEPDCSKGASSNVCEVSASLDHLTIRANRGTIAVCSIIVLLILLLIGMYTQELCRAKSCKMAPVWFDRNISMYNAIDVTPCKWPPMYVVASYVCGRYAVLAIWFDRTVRM